MEWTEDQVRRAVGWQAFREGKSLAERGAPGGLKRGDGLATATFGGGKRRLRTVVRWRPHLEAECGCPANRRDGEICAHAVAVLLSLENAGEAETTSVARPETGRSDAGGSAEVPAFRLRFAPRLPRQLAAGALQCRLEAAGTASGAADLALAAWLSKMAAEPPPVLSVRGAEFAGLLTALAGHPRLTDADGAPVQVREDPMPSLALRSSERRGHTMRFTAAPVDAVFEWGDALAWMQDGEIGRAPVGESTAAWRARAAELLCDGELALDLDEFVAAADLWLDLFRSPPPGWLGELRFRRTEPEMLFEIEGSTRALDGKLTTRGADGPTLEDGCISLPNPGAGRQAGRELRDLGFELDGAACRLRDPERILAFLADELPRLEQKWRVRVGERLRHILRSIHVVRPQMTFETDQPDSPAWLDLSFQTDAGKTIPSTKVREILRSGKRSVTTRSGAQVVISREVEEQLEPLLADLGIATREGRIQIDQAAAEALQNFRKNTDKSLHENILKKYSKIDIQDLGSFTLRPYQAAGAHWINDRLKRFGGALLADDMGLGKTIQTIASINLLKRSNELNEPVLIVVPTSLLGNWRDELARFAPDLGVLTLHGSGRDRLRDDAAVADVVLTSYGTLARDLAFHLRTSYGLLVVDEASVLRNPDSEISRAVAKLTPARRLALTGTPVENRLRDLWSIFRVVAPAYLGGKDEFLERYEGGGSEAGRRLKWRVSPYVLRRTKREVAGDLPDRIELDHWLDLDDDARALYRDVAAAGLNRWEELNDEGQTGAASMHLLTVILRLRQICLDRRLVDPEAGVSGRGVKSEWLETLLEERSEEGEKTLIFSQFTTFLRDFKKLENERFGRLFLLDGATRDRSAVVREFQHHDGPAAFLISLKAGGYGLNLTAADAVVHMDPWWNPAVEAQASDRAHRIGQDRPVTIHRLLVRDSVEERVRRLQAAKRSLVAEIHGDAPPSDWKTDDLRSLLE